MKIAAIAATKQRIDSILKICISAPFTNHHDEEEDGEDGRNGKKCEVENHVEFPFSFVQGCSVFRGSYSSRRL